MANRAYDIEEAGIGEVLLAYEEAIGFMCGTQVNQIKVLRVVLLHSFVSSTV
jgi:hypothetical protein